MTPISALGGSDGHTLVLPRLAPLPDPPRPPIAEVLLLEDDRDVARVLQVVLQAHGYSVTLCGSLSVARDWMSSGSFGIYLVDLHVSDGTGYQLIAEIKTAHPESHVVVLSAETEPQSFERCFALGASDYITKPFSLIDLGDRMDRLMES